MSRIGKKPVAIPQGVQVELNGNVIAVKGPKGQLTRELRSEVDVAIENNEVIVTRSSDDKLKRSLHGLTRTLIFNMIEGVTKGFEKSLDIVGVGYRAQKQGTKLVLQMGYSHPVEMEAANGIEFDVPTPNKVIVKGIDKEIVGQVAANIRKVRKPEPYKGKGIRYTNEVVRRKVGKTGKK
ncbi:MAG: 50S ribosomal protein L6 [bacterium]